MAKCIFVWRPRQLSHAIPTRAEEGRRRRPLNVESMIYRRLYPRSTVICLPCQFVKGTYPRVQSVYNELSSSRHVRSVHPLLVLRGKKETEGSFSLFPFLPFRNFFKVFIPLACRTLVESNNFPFAPSVGNILTDRDDWEIYIYIYIRCNIGEEFLSTSGDG